MIYFKNKNTNAILQVGDDTPRFLAQCLVNSELQEINKEEYDALNPVIEQVEYQPSHDELLASEIKRKYSIDDQLAIILNKDLDEAHRKEYEDMQSYRQECKDKLKQR